MNENSLPSYLLKQIRKKKPWLSTKNIHASCKVKFMSSSKKYHIFVWFRFLWIQRLYTALNVLTSAIFIAELQCRNIKQASDLVGGVPSQ